MYAVVSRGSKAVRLAGGPGPCAARRQGVQVGTIDASLAQLRIRYELALLTTDADFARVAEQEPLERWMP